MIQGQQSFAQQQGKVAVCEWRYKHSLTSLECNQYASYKTASRHRYSGSRCYKCFFDDDHATITIFSTFFSLWIVHNFLKLSVRFLQYIYRPLMDHNTKYTLNQEQARRTEELLIMNT